jgi:XTP/dITP diphosphohydrolase
VDLLIATRNRGKVREFRELLGDDVRISDLNDYPQIPEIAEIGKTFAENAIIKALAVSGQCSGWVLGDDSGLEVDSLGGAPGIYSARYAGEPPNDGRNIEKLQDDLANSCKEQRVARFRCVLALAEKGKLLDTFAGTVEGTVIDHARGAGGFGYDPIFVPNGFEQTFAELPAATKNVISHRAQAVKALRTALRSREG